MTLLPGEAPAVDGPSSTQMLLVRRYLGRVRPQPPLRARPSRSLPHPSSTSGVPAAVRDAMDFIEAYAADPIGLTEIAAAARLSPRALQAAFRRYLDITPLGHLRSVRLARTHADLLVARRGDGRTVSEIACRWGLSQLSRFASDYKAHYGVSPRETLSQAQQ